MIELSIALTSPTAKLPAKHGWLEAGIDFYADLQEFGAFKTIFPGQRLAVSLGVAMAIPDGWFLRLAPRSGLALKNGIMTMAGVIDCTYRGEVVAIIYNSGDEKFVVKHGDKIIQGYLAPVPEVEIRQVKKISDLPASERGEKGFGSSGV